RQGAGVGNGTGRERDHYEGHADEDGEDHADHGAPLLKAFCRLLTRVVPPAFAERTKNAQFLPRWCRRSGSNRRPAAYKAAALPLSYGGDGADCTPRRRSSGLTQFSLTQPPTDPRSASLPGWRARPRDSGGPRLWPSRRIGWGSAFSILRSVWRPGWAQRSRRRSGSLDE